MRRSFLSIGVAAATALLPLLAMAGNQEMAEQVAKSLRASGQLHDYKIGVKYEDGTAWLKGQVISEEQAKAAMALASQVPGVTRVKNELTVAPAEPAAKEPATGSRVQFSRETSPSARLHAAGGAFAPEQTSRVTSAPPAGGWVGSTLDASSMQRLQQAQQMGPAQPVATSFAQVPASPVMATEEPAKAQKANYQTPTPVRTQRPVPVAYTQPPAAAPAEMAPPSPAGMAAGVVGAPIAAVGAVMPAGGGYPMPAYGAPCATGVAPARYDQPNMPCYAWPSYASYPNYAAVTYPRQYSPTAWPYIGPFYPYPQVPLGWRKVTLEWDDGWWMLDFKDRGCN